MWTMPAGPFDHAYGATVIVPASKNSSVGLGGLFSDHDDRRHNRPAKS